MAHTSYYPPSGIYADSYKKDMRIIKTRAQRIMAVIGFCPASCVTSHSRPEQ